MSGRFPLLSFKPINSKNMKLIKNDIRKQSGNHERLMLLAYWFISNQHNAAVFEALQEIQDITGKESVRIVCLNPFNSTEDIANYKSKLPFDFEFEKDSKHSGMFYNVSSYPTFILMEKSGRIIHRQNGLSEESFTDEFINLIKQSRNFMSGGNKIRKVDYDSLRPSFKFG